jgi:type VI secretion system secreted protein VgrG
MIDALFTVTCSALPKEAVLVGWKGEEGLSRPYRYEIFATVPPPDDLEDAIGASATLAVHHGLPPYEVHGVVTGADVIHEVEGHAMIRLVVEPRLQLLSLTLHSRVFTRKRVPEIIVEILRDNGLEAPDFELRLTRAYTVQEHVCQYKESDLAFISRWMEREGIYYFFEQGERAEKLVIIDDVARHGALSELPVRYFPTASVDRSHGDSLQRFRCRRARRPAGVKVKDQDYEKPGLDVSAGAPALAEGAGEIVDHGYRFWSPADAKRLAAIRAEEQMALQTTFTGAGLAFHLRPGYTFELWDHPIAWMNTRYLCVEIHHRGNLSAKTAHTAKLTGLDPRETYHVEVVAIDAKVQYRPPRVTPWPRVHGFEVAVVDGPAESDYAQIDDMGRYHVKLHFDESALNSGNASTWIRMMQPHGGNPEAWHFPLRKHTEVMVGFLHGDPDRPFIAGAIPNAATPAVVTAKNHTRNIIHTGSDNHIELEDLKGSQWIDVKSPPMSTHFHVGAPHDDCSHNVVLHTTGDALFQIGSNQDILVGATLKEDVKGAVSETYSSTQTTKIEGPQTTTVTAGVTEKYDATQLTVVTSQVTESYHTGQTSTVSGGQRLEVFGAHQQTKVTAGVTQEWTGPHLRSVTGATSNTHNGTLLEHVTATTQQTFPAGVTQSWGPVTARFASLDWSIPGGATVTAPKFHVTIPTDDWTFLNSLHITGMSVELTLFDHSSYGTSKSVTGSSTTRTGAQASATGVSLGVAGLDAVVTAGKSHAGGLALELYGLIVVV